MAITISIEDLGNGKYKITDSDQQTRVVDNSIAIQEAGKSGVKIQKAGNASTGYTNNAAGQDYPSGTPTVIVNGKTVSVTDAINQARSAKNLGLIRKNLLDSNQLTKAEARDPNNLLDKWSQIVYGASQDPDPANKDPFKYAQSLQAQGFASTVGVQQYDPYAQATVYDPTKAASFITENFNKLLHRDPTAQELTQYTNDLKKEQNKPSSASKTTYKMVNGVRTSVTTTGLDETKWLTNQLQGTDEFKKTQERLNSTAAQQLQSAAAANGVTLTPDQLSDWTAKIAKGENVETFKSILRNQAALGQPEGVKKLLGQGVDLESIYSPYKTAMSKVLEINPDTITLNDPVLRSAIKPEGEMSIYDFQRALKKDPRWQYTNNAKDEVSSSVMQVLKDFGFKG